MITTNYLHVEVCPYCGRPSRDNRITLKLIIPIIDLDCDILRCTQCKIYYKAWIPDNEFLNIYYGREYTSYSPAPHAEDQLAIRLQELEKQYFQRGTGSMLDIGASNGLLVRAALARGWDAWGVEPYSAALDNIPTYVHERIYQQFFDEKFKPGMQFDLITLWDVIEHVRNPKELITLCITHLSTGGILNISTPNYNALGRIYSGKEWGPLLEPSHLSFWSPSMARINLPLLGLKILSIYSSGNPIGYNIGAATGVSRPDLLPSNARGSNSKIMSSLKTVIRRQLSIIKTAALRSPRSHQLIRKFIRTCSLGDNMNLTARKPDGESEVAFMGKLRH